jgi:hypothetical protein
MSAISKLISLGKRIETKLVITAQTTSAQASDIELALQAAKLWDLSAQVAPLLNSAGVPETVALQINILVDKALNVSFEVKTTPPHGSANALARLLKAAYGNKMKEALVAAKLSISDTLEVKWLTF